MSGGVMILEVENENVEQSVSDKQIAKEHQVTPRIASFHAGAETHVFTYEKNAKGETFKPYLVGAANIYDMHSANERVEISSLEKGFELIKALFLKFNAID